MIRDWERTAKQALRNCYRQRLDDMLARSVTEMILRHRWHLCMMMRKTGERHYTSKKAPCVIMLVLEIAAAPAQGSPFPCLRLIRCCDEKRVELLRHNILITEWSDPEGIVEDIEGFLVETDTKFEEEFNGLNS